jgi:hypothetical protein
MKRWAAITVLLYASVLVLLTAPLVLLACGRWWGHLTQTHTGVSVADAFALYRAWGYWLWLGVMALGQGLLLLVPVDVSQRRLTSRRKLLVPVITSAFLFANVVFAGLMSVACAIAGDDAFNVFNLFGDKRAGWTLAGMIAVLWGVWGVIFFRMTRANEPQDAAARLIRWLLRGSILELLVAVPSHVIVRQRDVCCAPAASFWGIATGLSVMLVCYGPGVLFLFAQRAARKRPPIDSVAAPR